MAEVRRVVWSNPLLKKSHIEHIAQDCTQMAFEYLQQWRLHNLPEWPVPVLSHSHRKNVFPSVQEEPPMFQFVPVASGLGHH